MSSVYFSGGDEGVYVVPRRGRGVYVHTRTWTYDSRGIMQFRQQQLDSRKRAWEEEVQHSSKISAKNKNAGQQQRPGRVEGRVVGAGALFLVVGAGIHVNV